MYLLQLAIFIIFIYFLVCREDQLVTDCACSMNCSSPADAVCDRNTCKLGCMCPDGTFDNGTNCVPREKCYCTDDAGGIRQVFCIRGFQHSKHKTIYSCNLDNKIL